MQVDTTNDDIKRMLEVWGTLRPIREGERLGYGGQIQPLPTPGESAERALRSHSFTDLELNTLDSAIAGMSWSEVQIIRMRYRDNFKLWEIAEVIMASIGTASNRINSATDVVCARYIKLRISADYIKNYNSR